jgi:response regulator of citrate/malate metabolism
MKRSLSLMKFKTNRVCPVVAVTAYTDESTYKKAERVGIKKVINKPVNKTALEEVLNKYYFD